VAARLLSLDMVRLENRLADVLGVPLEALKDSGGLRACCVR